jgi:vitamin B12 transporter
MQSLFLEGGVEQVIGFGLTDYHRRDTDSGPFIPPVFDGQSRTFDAQWNFLLTETNTFSVGAQYYAEDASSTFNPETSQYNRGMFLQDQWQLLEAWYVGVGVRWDDHSRAGPAETYRANTNYTLPTNTDIHASLGTGFRAPALAENLFAFGNPDLLPERSKGWDIGATQRLFNNRVSFDATYFRNDFDDLIVFDFNTFRLENVGRSRASGVELSGEWLPLEDTRLYANYTLTDTLDLATGLPLVRRPRDKATVGIDQYFFCRQARLGAYMLYVGERLDTRQSILDEYMLVNLNGSLYLSERAELFARIDNAFNEHYEEVLGFGTVGIAGYAGMNFIW